MRQPSDRAIRFFRDTTVFLIGVAGAIYNLFILPTPNTTALGVILLFLFGPAALQYRELIQQQRPDDDVE